MANNLYVPTQIYTEASFQRGSIYYVEGLPGGVGSEFMKTRPCVIVSNDLGNRTSDTVTVCPLTTAEKELSGTRVLTYATGRKSYILCEHITAIDVSRIKQSKGRLNEEEMDKVERCIAYALDLKMGSKILSLQKELDESKAEKEALEAKLKRQMESNDEGAQQIMKIKYEADKYRAMYEKAIQELAKKEFDADFAAASPAKVETQVAIVETESKTETEDKSAVLVNLNEASNDDIVSELGLTHDMAIRITTYRSNNGGFKSKDELKNVRGIGKRRFDLLRERVTV